MVGLKIFGKNDGAPWKDELEEEKWVGFNILELDIRNW